MSDSTTISPSSTGNKTALVSIVGRPSAGKSTFLNTAAGEKTMELFRVATEEFAVVEKAPLLEGRFLTMILGPKADK